MKKLLFASVLSSALLAGTAMHAQSVDVDANVGVGGSGADASVDANVGVGGTSADASVDANVGGGGTSADANVSTSIASGAEADADINLQTGSISGDASATASLTLIELGVDAEVFFTDETMTELATELEIQAAFSALTDEQQAQLQDECAEVSASPIAADDNATASMAELCAAIETM